MSDRPPASAPKTGDVRHLTDQGRLRDKVAARDPAAAPLSTDSEAAGTPTPPAAAAADLRAQSARASRAVPRLDPDRAVSTYEHLERGPWREPIVVALALALAGTAAFVAITLLFTLP